MAIAEVRTEVAATEAAIFHSILVATDFSDVSRHALSSAIALAERHHAHLSVVHVSQNDWRYEMLDNPPEMALEKLDAEEKLGASLKDLHLAGKVDSVLTRRGAVAAGVASAIRECAADLLVIGTHGRGGFSKLALGSVAEELLRIATVPVITVSPHAELKNHAKFHAIVFATDFGAGSTKVLPLVIALTRKERAKLILLHMIAPMPATSMSLSAYAPGSAAADELQAWEGSSRQRGLRRLREWIGTQSVVDLKPEFIVGTDFLPEGILTAASQMHADLIVMGANASPSPRVAAHLPWTAVHEVVQHANCPVLTFAG